MPEGTYGLSTEEHNNMDVDAYYARVYEAVKRHKGGVIVDVFSGGPRDTLNMIDVLDGDGFFAAIDSEADKISDLVNKNFDISGRQKKGLVIPDFSLVDGKRQFELVNNWMTVARDGAVAVFQHRFPSVVTGSRLPFTLKADFMLCNAGIMFVEPENLDFTLAEMAEHLNDGGELALRFSGARDDKLDALNKTYFMHDPDYVEEVLQDAGLLTVRYDNQDDPDGRGFEWFDIGAYSR